MTPFRKTRSVQSDWIPITDGQWEDKPRFSHDDRLMFFTSSRDGFNCIWAQPLQADMHPIGVPFAVYHEHERRRALSNVTPPQVTIDAGPNMIVFNRAELTGNIWLLEPPKPQ